MSSILSFLRSRCTAPVAAMLSMVVVLLFFGGILAVTHNPLSLDDGLRHFVMAKEQLRLGIGAVTWSRYFFLTYFIHHAVDPWFLANLSYVPFTFFTSSVAGIKAATFAFLCVLAFSFSLFLRRFPVTPFFTALIIFLFFFGSDTFGFRLMLGRPFVLVSALMLFVLHALITRRWLLLAVLLALSTLFSHLFIFPFGIAVIGSLWWLFICRHPRSVCASVFATMGGMTTGIILHPQSREYVLWMKNIFFVVPFSKELDLGGEIYNGLGFADAGVYLLLISCILLIFLLAVRQELANALHRRPEIILLGVLALLFFAAYLLWVRAIDLFWPMGVILLLSLVSATDGAMQDAKRFLFSKQFPLGIRAMHVVIVLFVITSAHHLWLFVGNDDRRSVASFSAINAVPAGSTVFNADWEYFPVLFFLRSDLLYARGMDPTHDELPVRSLIAKLHEAKFLPKETLFSREWFTELWSRVDMKQLGIRRMGEKDVDADAWLMELRSIAQPQYLALYRGAHPRLIQSLTTSSGATLFSESRAMIIFSLHPSTN